MNYYRYKNITFIKSNGKWLFGRKVFNYLSEGKLYITKCYDALKKSIVK